MPKKNRVQPASIPVGVILAPARRAIPRGWAWVIFLCLSAGLVFLDQWLKVWSTTNLSGQPRRVVLDGILGLTYFHNTGAAFGFLNDVAWGMWFLTVVKAILLSMVMYYFTRLRHGGVQWMARLALILVFAGGLGNLIDRIRLGYVVDMLEFLFIRFAIFNLADVYVTVGVVALFIAILAMGKDAPWFGETKA